MFKYIIGVFAQRLKNNPKALDYLFSVLLRDELVKLSKQRGSIINSPYKHIEFAIELCNTSQLDEQGIIIDIGCANGDIAKIFLNSFPDNKIYVFEPNTQFSSQLIKLSEDNEHLIFSSKALGSVPSQSHLNIAQNVGSSSILTFEKDASSENFGDNLKKVDEIEVLVSTLDEEIPGEKVNIMKVDVQGYELEVIKGGKETLSRTSIIVLEQLNHDHYKKAAKYYKVDEFMRNNGFTLYDLFPSVREHNKLHEWDAIYVNNNMGR